MTLVTNTHICNCGNVFDASGWNNNYGKILRCEECTTKREALLAQFAEAIHGRNIEVVYISTTVRDLVMVDDFDDFQVEISYRRPERMNGLDFLVVEA